MDHDEARKLAETEYERFANLIGGLDEEAWTRSTDCTGWDVKAIVGHLIGMLELVASPEERERQQKTAGEALARTGGYRIDALTALQVAEHSHLTSAEMRATFSKVVSGAISGRFDTPEQVRAMPYTPGPPFEGDWTLGYLWEVIMTRDPWMHRVDISRATGTPLEITPEHDGCLVADVVEDWAALHGSPFTLTLTGPAGGTFTDGSGGPAIELDAVEFCRILSGRAPGTGLLAHAVAF